VIKKKKDMRQNRGDCLTDHGVNKLTMATCTNRVILDMEIGDWTIRCKVRLVEKMKASRSSRRLASDR